MRLASRHRRFVLLLLAGAVAGCAPAVPARGGQAPASHGALRIVLEHPQLIGVGLDESTALVVGPDGRWSVIGESSAVIHDARDATVTPKGAPVLGAAGVRMHVLPPGATHDPATGAVGLAR